MIYTRSLTAAQFEHSSAVSNGTPPTPLATPQSHVVEASDVFGAAEGPIAQPPPSANKVMTSAVRPGYEPRSPA